MASYTKSDAGVQTLAGTQTERNLHTALSGESQAYLRYKWFEEKAKNDGYVAISQLFHETAENEKEHAEIWFRYLGGVSGTEKNLEVAAAGENFEWSNMYAEFEETARREGFEEIAKLFSRVAGIERMHEQNYKHAKDKIVSGRAFSAPDSNTRWICLNCGYVVTGTEPPAVCPTCSHPQGYFKEYKGN